MTDPVTDPRRADAHLHRAAEVLRRTARGAARGPWRWSDPDPEAGAAERLDRPTSMKDLAAFPGRPTAPPDLVSIVVDRDVDLVGEAVAPHTPRTRLRRSARRSPFRWPHSSTRWRNRCPPRSTPAVPWTRSRSARRYGWPRRSSTETTVAGPVADVRDGTGRALRGSGMRSSGPCRQTGPASILSGEGGAPWRAVNPSQEVT